MYLPRNSSKSRLREAQNARNNRAEIVKALSQGEVTRRDLFKWGIFTTTGALALKNGLSPFAPSTASASIPTGVPASPLFGAQPFTQHMPRLAVQEPVPLSPLQVGNEVHAAFPPAMNENYAKRLSWHTEFSATNTNQYKNPITNRGPMEGRPPGEFFAHQRWQEYFPKKAYVLSIGQCESETYFHDSMPNQDPNSVWSLNGGKFTKGLLPPPLIKVRYGEPVIYRLYNNLPVNRADNGGFGLNQQTTHNHNAHNASASDGASNVHFFPGQFYDYHWGTTLARADMINTDANDARASGPDGSGGLNKIPGDFRELQGSLWFHDHRFFFTAENVYKGHLGMLNYYSGPDRGHEELDDGVNLRLPSGTLLDSGNVDFDVNLMITDMASSQDGQYFFDIFDTDGFLGDLLLVNFAYAPYFEVLPRKYRFRILCGCMSRFLKLVLVNESGSPIPVDFIANDGNFVVNPIRQFVLDQLGVSERFDIVVDFSNFRIGDKITMVNMLQFFDGRGPDKEIGIRDSINGRSTDPAVGPVMEFRVVDQVESVDVPGVTHRATDPDNSRVPFQLTEQIPIVEPVRVREIEWKRGGGDDPRDAMDGQCIPDCGGRESFPWSIKINGQDAHTLNANRVSLLVPKPGEVEHWTLKNGGGGWDHPIHLHFEEGITMDRGGDFMPATERLARKDVWRLREGGTVRFQVTFGEYGGTYVNHCHNTVHEDNAMLLRYDVLTGEDGRPQVAIIPTPIPTPDGVSYMTPEILPEGDPRAVEPPPPPPPPAPTVRRRRRRRRRGRSRTRRG